MDNPEAKHDASFAQWLAEVDTVLQQKFGYVHDQLPDWGYVDAFDLGVAPADAAQLVMDSAWADADESGAVTSLIAHLAEDHPGEAGTDHP
jgi:hypothetical protein